MKRKLIDCPDCDCVFVTEKDLQYHLLTHIPSSRPPTKEILPLELRRRKYAEILRLFRLKYISPGQQLNRDRVKPRENHGGVKNE